MAIFVMLTRLAPGEVRSPAALEQLEREAMQRVRAVCPSVEWLQSFAILGPYDYLDLFRAPDIETAMKVSTLIRTYGRAHTEVWAATEWQRFKAVIRDLRGAKAEPASTLP
jgi:uncharacterized protein with GYD domain